MKRRDFFKLIGTGAAAAVLAPSVSRAAALPLSQAKWRGYQLTYQITLPAAGKVAKLWLPLPDTNDTVYQFTQGNNWSGKATASAFYMLPGTASPVFFATWQKGEERTVKVSSIVKTAHRAVDLSFYQAPVKASIPQNIQRYLQPTKQVPLDNAVKKLAHSITSQANAHTPLQQARAVYDWIIDNVTYDNNVRGQGRGDIRSMLSGENFSGKCADIHSLFVGLARASGIPARIQYGIRIGESSLNKNLGKSGDVSTSQHCQAEFYLAGLGWVPVDPSDVARVMTLESLPGNHDVISQLREKLFGSWEMNWVAFNDGENVDLGKACAAGRLPFFLYPHAEIDGKQQDSLEPESFSYKITSATLVGTGAKL
ncbi:transglutaminase domain-containing protein [Nitrosomonas sp.]|uniref:transglutaminase domain-containing protein n=1 Tax=Nitrosomonas sp. TaxID=42353 RepID=UPI0025F688B6|nr:transglutaminase domain-containing protein [Nitrosomonas sp.]